MQASEQEELMEEDSEEDAEDEHSAAEDEEAPEPLGGHGQEGELGPVWLGAAAGLGMGTSLATSLVTCW